MTLPAALLLAYLVGAIPTSWIAAKLGAGIDLREHGSKNLGATNLYRVLGWRWAIPVGAFDIAKGTAPTLLLPPRIGPASWIPLAVGAAAIVGHVFSVFVRFRGGKGVATSAGVVLALAPVPLGASALAWIAVLWGTGYMSLASITGAVAFPIAAWALGTANPYVLPVGALLAAFIVFTHRANLRRLIAGTENRFGRRGRVR
jgi:acyl phosphate:glycerol-3-phosphate acyltransferase